MIRTSALKTRKGALIVFITAMVLLAGGVLLLWAGDSSPAANIEVRGNRYLASEEVILLSGLESGMRQGGKVLRKARRALLKHPVIRDAEIARAGSGLVITVFERACVALVREDAEGRLREVDREARILSRDEIRCSGVPIISGRFKRTDDCSGARDGCFQSKRLRGLIDGYLRLKKMYPTLAARISELRFRHDGALDIHMTGTRVRMVTSGRLAGSDINRIYAALAYLEGEKRYRGVMDLRERDGLFFP